MNNIELPVILLIDDDCEFTQLVERWLKSERMTVKISNDSPTGLALASYAPPDLILLDLFMPQMDGHQFCRELQKQNDLAKIPILFLTSSDDPKNKAEALALGAVGYLTKPITQEKLIASIRAVLNKRAEWEERIRQIFSKGANLTTPYLFSGFKKFLTEKGDLSEDVLAEIEASKSEEFCDEGVRFGLTADKRMRDVAEYCGKKYYAFIDPQRIELGVLPTPFCRTNLVVPLKDEQDRNLFIISNPFSPNILDLIRKNEGVMPFEIGIADPKTITALFDFGVLSQKQ